MLQVSLFAEMFWEMLQQRYGRALLRGLQRIAAERKDKEPKKADK